MTQVVAIESLVAVRGIVDPLEAGFLRVGLEFRTRYIDQGPHQPAHCKPVHHPDAGKSRRTAAAQEIQQQRLGLVVAMVRAQQPVVAADVLREGRVARVAGGRFQAGSGASIDLRDFGNEFDVQAPGQLPAVLAPGSRIRL